MMGIELIYTLLFLGISMLLIAIALWGRGAQKYPRLQSVYRDKFLDESATLDDDLARGKIDQETYESTKVTLAQDLLAVAHPDRKINGFTKLLLLLFGGAIIAGSALLFWQDGYSEDARNLDTQRRIAMPYVQKWLAGLTIEELQSANTIADLNPPLELQNNLVGTLTALNLMSSSDHHTDPKELNLLGKIYLNMDQLPLAEKTYLDLYRLNPNNTNTYYTLLNIQLAMNNYQLNDRLEALFDQFVMRNQDNESLLLYYGTVLFENQKANKAMHYFSILADRYPEGSENRRLITNMIASLTGAMEQGALMAAQSVPINVELDLANVDVTALPNSAILYIFVRNSQVGPPLAAKRIPVAEIQQFPLSIAITDSDLLMQNGGSLANQDALSVSAKISLTGDPISGKGDIEAQAISISDITEPVKLVLDRIVE